MPLLIQEFFASLQSPTAWGIYLLAFLLLFLCGLGSPVPEDLILLFLGYLSFQGDVHLIGSNITSFAGILVGDLVIYHLGKRYGYGLLKTRFFRWLFTPQRIEKVRHAFNLKGNLYLFLARFAPGLRSVTYWAAGMFRIPVSRFLFYDGLAAVLSVPLFIFLGYKLGEAFHLLLGRIKILSIIFGGIILAIFIVSFILSYRKAPPLLHPHIPPPSLDRTSAEENIPPPPPSPRDPQEL